MPAGAVTVTANWSSTGGGTPPTDPPTDPPADPPADPTPAPTTDPLDNDDDTAHIGGAEVMTPPGQDPIDNGDGSTTLPGGGTITVPGNDDGKGSVTINAPPGTVITDDGRITFPHGDGGTVAYGNIYAFGVPEDAVIILDDNVPLGFYIALDNPFSDLKASDWFLEYVMFVYSHGLMVGTSADPMMFSPNEATTRGMIVTVLYRLSVGADGNPPAGRLPSPPANPFIDVPESAYYYDAVIWAAASGIVKGYGNGLYGPDDNVTREQLSVILNNYINFAGLTLPESRSYAAFLDDADCGNYAKEAIELLFKAGIIAGKPGNIFDPKGNATRAEVAAMLMRFLEAAE